MKEVDLSIVLAQAITKLNTHAKRIEDPVLRDLAYEVKQLGIEMGLLFCPQHFHIFGAERAKGHRIIVSVASSLGRDWHAVFDHFSPEAQRSFRRDVERFLTISDTRQVRKPQPNKKATDPTGEEKKTAIVSQPGSPPSVSPPSPLTRLVKLTPPPSVRVPTQVEGNAAKPTRHY